MSEKLTFRRDFAVSPDAAALMAVPVLVGLLGALFGAAATRGLARARWLFLAAIIALGFAVASQSLRVFSSTMPLAAMGLLASAAAVRESLISRGKLLAATLGFVTLCVL